MKVSGATDDRLIEAFSRVSRENYLGPGPWEVFVGREYMRTIDGDPRHVYQDILIGVKPEAKINNGQPTLHACCMDAAQLESGARVVHVGAGTGYYTAILACLVGPRGKVVAFEIDTELARRATSNLAGFENVEVHSVSAAEVAIPECDLLYVSAGVTDPPAEWLDALGKDGRLIFPLTADEGSGVMLKVTRTPMDRYAACALIRAGFIPCVGVRSADTARALAAALESESMYNIRSLRRHTAPDATAWCAGNGWWLSTEAP